MTQGRKRSVLLVEKDTALREILERGLNTLGQPLITCARAQDVVGKIGKERLGLIVYAVDPTDMHDLVAMMRVREVPAGRGAPMLVLAPGGRSELARVKGMLAPFDPDDFVTKPVDFARLETAVKALVDTSEIPPPSEGHSSSLIVLGAVTIEELREVYNALGRLNYYERLQVRPGDDARAIRAGFMKKVNRYRPETVPIKTDEARRLMRGIHEALGEAYGTLRDPTRKSRYDRKTSATRVRKEEPPEAAPEAAAEAIDGPDAPQPEPEPDTSWSKVRTLASHLMPSADISSHSLSPPAAVAKDEPEKTPEELEELEEEEKQRKKREEEARRRGEPVNPEDLWERGTVVDTSTEDKLADGARLQAVMGNYEGALALATQALRLQPDNQDFKYKVELYKGWAAKKAGNLVGARRYFEMAALLAPPGQHSADEELEALGVKSKKKKKKKKKTGGLSGLFSRKKKDE